MKGNFAEQMIARMFPISEEGVQIREHAGVFRNEQVIVSDTLTGTGVHNYLACSITGM